MAFSVKINSNTKPVSSSSVLLEKPTSFSQPYNPPHTPLSDSLAPTPSVKMLKLIEVTSSHLGSSFEEIEWMKNIAVSNPKMISDFLLFYFHQFIKPKPTTPPLSFDDLIQKYPEHIIFQYKGHHGSSFFVAPRKDYPDFDCFHHQTFDIQYYHPFD